MNLLKFVWTEYGITKNMHQQKASVFLLKRSSMTLKCWYVVEPEYIQHKSRASVFLLSFQLVGRYWLEILFRFFLKFSFSFSNLNLVLSCAKASFKAEVEGIFIKSSAVTTASARAVDDTWHLCDGLRCCVFQKAFDRIVAFSLPLPNCSCCCFCIHLVEPVLSFMPMAFFQ